MLNQKRIKKPLQSQTQDYIKTNIKTKILKIVMFIAEALYPFSEIILKQQQTQSIQQNQSKKSQQNFEQTNIKQNQVAALIATQNRPITDEVKRSLKFDQKQEVINQNQQSDKKQQSSQIHYLNFQRGDKIKVQQAYQNGWWYGSTLKNPQRQGFFPSNYVQIASKPKPPPPPPQQLPSQLNQELAYDPDSQGGIDWVQKQLRNITQGPVKSDYYLGIKGYKNVKIDQKNQNILKGDHVKFDVSTGLAKVPVKDQAPAAKAVRQMGYYFDYHQWVEERNKHPGQKSRPDPKKKKIKKLNLKGMK